MSQRPGRVSSQPASFARHPRSSGSRGIATNTVHQSPPWRSCCHRRHCCYWESRGHGESWYSPDWSIQSYTTASGVFSVAPSDRNELSLVTEADRKLLGGLV